MTSIELEIETKNRDFFSRTREALRKELTERIDALVAGRDARDLSATEFEQLSALMLERSQVG